MSALTTRWRWPSPRALFTRLLGLSHLSASLSWAAQAAHLIGSEGVSSVAARVSAGHSSLTWPQLSLLSLSQSDAWISILSLSWVIGALLLSLNRAPLASLLLCLSCAVSLSQGAAPFLPFQWDLLLHEASLLALLYLPLRRAAPPTLTAIRSLALRLLLFKLIWDSGAAKTLGGDELWSSLKALYVHFWTQPLPHLGASLVVQLPEYVLRAGAYLTLAIELWVPWLILLRVRRPLPLWLALLLFSFIGAWRSQAPSFTSLDTLAWLTLAITLDERLLPRWRAYLPQLSLGPYLHSAWSAAGPIGLLMILISATGSYGFFQLLTLALCVPLFDRQDLQPPSTQKTPLRGSYLWLITGAWLLWSLTLHLPWAPHSVRSGSRSQRAYRWVAAELAPLQLVARYGLFARMTSARAELIIEGSADGASWSRYVLPYQANGEAHPPPMAGLHMPRLDWMMWFEALSPSCRESWLLDLLEAIFEGRPPVLSQLKSEAHQQAPPRYLRVRRALYQPSASTFWRARDAGLFCPAMSLQELKRARAHVRGLPKLSD